MKVMPNLCLMLGISPTLFTFSFICLITSLWSWCVIPETRGLTLTQVNHVHCDLVHGQQLKQFDKDQVFTYHIQISLSFSGRKETAAEREAEVKTKFCLVFTDLDLLEILWCESVLKLLKFREELFEANFPHFRYAQVEARLLHIGARSRMPRMESFTNSIG